MRGEEDATIFEGCIMADPGHKKKLADYQGIRRPGGGGG